MLEDRRAEQQTPGLQVDQHFLVGLFAEHAGPLGLLGHAALGVHQLHEGQAVLAAHVGVVLTEGGSNVNDTGTVGQGDVAVAGHIPALLLGRNEVEQGLVLLVLQVLALVALQHGVTALAQHGVGQSLSDVVHGAVLVHLDLHIGLDRVHTQSHVGRQGPGGGGPGQDVGVFALGLELGNGAALLHVLIALSNLMAGQRGSAAGAVGHDLEALVQKALFPDLLQSPPLGLDEGVVIGHIGVVHIGPEADGAGEILPHALVFPDALLALLNEGLQTILLNLLLAIQAQQFLHFQLNGQAVSIPAGLAGHLIALHGPVAGDHILDNAGLHMADVGLAVGRGGAVIEHVGRPFLAGIDALLKDVAFLPELEHVLLAVNEIEIRVYFLVHLKSRPPCFSVF